MKLPRPLADPYFDAQFTRGTTAQGWTHCDELEGSDGLIFNCPCGIDNPGGAHKVIVSFANPRGCAPAPSNAGSQSRHGGPSRWTMRGTGVVDLTVAPSVDVGTPSCWHGFIEAGVVR